MFENIDLTSYLRSLGILLVIVAVVMIGGVIYLFFAGLIGKTKKKVKDFIIRKEGD